MCDLIPFDIQTEIIKRLPLKSVIQFRSVSRQWKSLIDCAKFKKHYHVNHTNPQHHFLFSYNSDTDKTYTSIIDNNTFPQQMFPLTPPESLSLLRTTLTSSYSVDGLLCLCGFYGDVDSETMMAIIWNPTIRKSVGIVIPKASMNTIVGFGVCPYTSDLKLVKINITKIPSMWEVDVFMLSTRVWKTVYTGAPYKSCNLPWYEVFVDGVIYFLAYDNVSLVEVVMSFDLNSEKFGEVCLPEKLAHAPFLDVAKVNDSLGLLEYYDDGDMPVCGVWTRKDGANKLFSKIYTIKFEGKSLYNRVLGFRNNGEVIIERIADNYEAIIEVCEPLSGHANGVGVNGKIFTFSAMSYMETLLLLDESDSIIH